VRKPPRRSPPAVLVVYLALVVPITILLNLSFINLHASDDSDHVKRAYTLIHAPFQMVTPPGRSTGAMIDSGLAAYIDADNPIVMHGAKGNTVRHAADQATRIGWEGIQKFSEMPGAMDYFPLLYAPQALMLELGRFSGASVAKSVLWARFANGFAGIILAAFGLYLLRAGHSLALILLLLPRTLLQFASNSADPVLYGLSLIIIALGLRMADTKVLGTLGLGAANFIAASVRPPVAVLALPGLTQAFRRRRWLSLGVIVGSCGAAALWAASIVTQVRDLRCPAVGSLPPRLATFALHWPALIGRTLEERSAYFYASFIGHYGWGDALGGQLASPLPMWMYLTAPALLCSALWQDLVARTTLDAMTRVSLALGASGSILLTFFAMYVACTVTTQPTIAGVQGRYFVPALFALAAAVAGLAKGAPSYPRAYFVALSAWVVAGASTMIADAYRFYPHP
jgi:uncharacterized membrane protein